jgi:hypothetical protein
MTEKTASDAPVWLSAHEASAWASGYNACLADQPQSPNNEEMENYRMALAYISKQSADPQSRELAETALSYTRPDREGQ